MRIAVDARELHGKPTGVGRYLSALLAAWKALPAAQAHEFVLLSPQPAESPGLAWEQFTLPRLVREAGANVLFAPGYTAPVFCPVPTVAAVHDVSFAAHPEWFRWKEGLRRRLLTRLTARRACKVLTISEFSKGEIVEHLGVDPRKVEVVYPAAHLAPRQGPPHRDGRQGPGGDGARHGGDRRRNLVLFVGSLFNRRHLPELIEGFGRLARRRIDVRLEIVGDNRTSPYVNVAHLASETTVGNRIRIRSYISDDELNSLYGEARAFIFLSSYEGFALTPLEALAAGVPVVLLDTPVSREIYGDAAIYVERADPALIDGALERALFDESERRRVLSDATATVARYSWEACASRVLQILTDCGAGRGAATDRGAPLHGPPSS